MPRGKYWKKYALMEPECIVEQLNSPCSDTCIKRDLYEDNTMFFMDSQGNILSGEEVDSLPPWEIEEREFHVYDPRLA